MKSLPCAALGGLNHLSRLRPSDLQLNKPQNKHNSDILQQNQSAPLDDGFHCSPACCCKDVCPEIQTGMIEESMKLPPTEDSGDKQKISARCKKQTH